MLDEEPFSEKLPANCLGGPFYVFRSIFNKIPDPREGRNSKRNNFIKIYPPPDLSVTMTHFTHQQTVHTHYIVQN